MSAITTTNSVANATLPEKTAEMKKLEKGIKTALALKITAIFLAIVLTAITIAAAVLFLPASVVIGISSLTGALLIGSLAALIAERVLQKKKRKEDERMLAEKEQQNEQVLQEMRTKITNFEKVSQEMNNSLPGMVDLFQKMDNFKKDQTTTTPIVEKRVEVEPAVDESKISTDLIEVV